MRRTVLIGFLAMPACIEYNPGGGFEGRIATTVGDFDDVAAPFDRMVVDHTDYEGLISTATWDPDYDPDNTALKVETLLGNGQDLDAFGAVFVASGTRGIGLREYDGLDADDALVADPYVIDQLADWVGTPGHVLVCTDWSYDLVERAFPGFVEFLGDDDVLDAAQAGEIGTVTADVRESRLADAIGEDAMSVTMDFSNWAVIEGVDGDVDVWLQADEVSYREQDGEGSRTQTDVPLLVSFSPDGQDGGRVVFSAFHFDAQTPQVMDAILRTVVGGLPE
jgi:hypothetical protein